MIGIMILDGQFLEISDTIDEVNYGANTRSCRFNNWMAEQWNDGCGIYGDPSGSQLGKSELTVNNRTPLGELVYGGLDETLKYVEHYYDDGEYHKWSIDWTKDYTRLLIDDDVGLSNSKVHVKGKNPDGNMNLFRFVACKNTTMCFKYYDTPDLVALDATDSVPITNTVTGYTWRGSSCEFLKGGDFSNFTGKFDFSYITFVKNVSNISQFQIQAYGQEHSVETLIAILDGLIDTTASPKSQGVGNTYNLRKLQATEAGLAAIARAEAKGWTITSNV